LRIMPSIATPWHPMETAMPDEIDQAQAHSVAELARNLAAVLTRAAAMPAGEPGDCDFCGEWTSRLVGGACAPYRDQRRLP